MFVRKVYPLGALFLCMQCVGSPVTAAEEPTQEESEKAPVSVQVEVSERDRRLLESLEKVFPMTPEEIETLRKNKDMVEEAVTKTPVATIISASRPLLLEPGQIPPPVVLTPGYAGAIAFFDATGAPWPVSRAVIGNNELFKLVSSTTTASSAEADVTAVGDQHVLYITPLREHANSNILVHLENSKSPASIQLISDPSSKANRRHEGIVTFMVRARGPNAKPPVFTSVTPTISETMMTLLDGVPPEGAALLKTKQRIEGLSIWHVQDKMYLRSPHTLRWPAYTAYAESGGIFVYEMTPVPSVMISKNGSSVSIIIEKDR